MAYLPMITDIGGVTIPLGNIANKEYLTDTTANFSVGIKQSDGNVKFVAVGTVGTQRIKFTAPYDMWYRWSVINDTSLPANSWIFAQVFVDDVYISMRCGITPSEAPWTTQFFLNGDISVKKGQIVQIDVNRKPTVLSSSNAFILYKTHQICISL